MGHPGFSFSSVGRRPMGTQGRVCPVKERRDKVGHPLLIMAILSTNWRLAFTGGAPTFFQSKMKMPGGPD